MFFLRRRSHPPSIERQDKPPGHPYRLSYWVLHDWPLKQWIVWVNSAAMPRLSGCQASLPVHALSLKDKGRNTRTHEVDPSLCIWKTVSPSCWPPIWSREKIKSLLATPSVRHILGLITVVFSWFICANFMIQYEPRAFSFYPQPILLHLSLYSHFFPNMFHQDFA